MKIGPFRTIKIKNIKAENICKKQPNKINKYSDFITYKFKIDDLEEVGLA